ncbi:methylase of polypeptide subunit release factors [Sphaerotilus hippei]|uniref:Methylase of polypeptide subunit release factors n=1 Tax=Sphaerotilus hippei TaxID=744406 RepID=A0A318H7I5_9BURK|nr:class I SAM-dependent methyltransferase [Sphaerotilus hippei]PXW93807.1 methylase of polypeptide subunit release factors [Sphaerotilus hippei]
MNDITRVQWTDAAGQAHSARWVCDSDRPPPRRIVPADDRMPADTAYRLACEGTGLLWQGDYPNARLMLQALTRRLDRGPRRTHAGRQAATAPAMHPMTAAFHQQRQAQAQRARVLGMLLLPVDCGDVLPLRRAPAIEVACAQAQGTATSAYVMPLRHLLGLIGAHEWRKKGVDVPATGGRIHAHYGVFSPVRGEYVQLVAQAPLPAACQRPEGVAFDIGTGTGVLAAVLAARGVPRITATDTETRALGCALENLQRLGCSDRVELLQTSLFPAGRQADLIVCNPPWLPGHPSSSLEHAIYDPDSRMLRGYLDGLAAHLRPQGEGWLILSDLAEHLHLRDRATLLAWIEQAGLKVIDRLDVRPMHKRASDAEDLLHAARSAEVTSLWRLGRR